MRMLHLEKKLKKNIAKERVRQTDRQRERELVIGKMVERGIRRQ